MNVHWRFLAGALAASGLGAAGPQAEEYAVKAALLYKLAQYVEWPAGAFPKADAAFTIGVLGSDPFGPHLDTMLKDKRLKDRPLRIVRSGDTRELRGCHLVFVAASEKERFAAVLEGFKGRHALLMSDSTGLARRGAGINLLLVRDGDAFRTGGEVNPGALAAAGLKVDAKLLKIFTPVATEGR